MMKIFFYDDGQSQASVMAGYIQLQKLPNNSTPSIQVILAIPEFNLNHFRTVGVPNYLGNDQFNREIYSIGFGPNKDHDLALQTLDFLLDKINKNYCFLNSTIKKNFYIIIGSICTRHLKLDRIGRYLMAYGIKKNYGKLLDIVESAKGLTGIG